MAKVKDDNNQTLTTYTYAGSRQRLITQEGNESSTNLTYYAWEGDTVIAEFTAAANNTLVWAKNYVFMGGALLATHTKITGGERLEFAHADRLGTRLVTNPNDGTYFEQATLPFGTALDSESTGSINRRFTSYDRSVSTGLDYAVNRFYNPSQGRFTQVDPIKFNASNLLDPQTLNLYSYTANDPVNRVDPDGKFWGAILGAIFSFFKHTNFRFKFTYKGIPFSFGFQGHFKNIYVGVAGFNVQITGQNSIFNQFRNFTGEFSKCLTAAGIPGGGGTGISQDAADLVLQISSLENVSPQALAVTWQWETGFDLYPPPNTNNNPGNQSNWDVGPFHINMSWTNKYINNGRLDISDIMRLNGIGGSNVWGNNLYEPSSVNQNRNNPSRWIPARYDGNPLANGRVAARRIRLNGGDERNQVKWYAPDPVDRGQKYDKWAPIWKKFFDCYK